MAPIYNGAKFYVASILCYILTVSTITASSKLFKKKNEKKKKRIRKQIMLIQISRYIVTHKKIGHAVFDNF